MAREKDTNINDDALRERDKKFNSYNKLMGLTRDKIEIFVFVSREEQ